MGKAKSSMASVFRMKVVTPKINAWVNTPISHTPMFWACKLQTKERWGWSNHGQLYLLSLTGVISTLHCWNAGIDWLHPFYPSTSDFSPLINQGSSGKCFKWMHGVSYSPILEKSHLYDAGPVADNLHFVALSHSHSSEFVPLGCWWCNWPTWPAQLHEDESPLSKQWEKVWMTHRSLSTHSRDCRRSKHMHHIKPVRTPHLNLHPDLADQQ